MATPIVDVAQALYSELTTNSKVKNPYTKLEDCVEAVRHARCKADHPEVWGTTVQKALMFHGLIEKPAKKTTGKNKAAEKTVAKSEVKKTEAKKTETKKVEAKKATGLSKAK